MWRGIPGAPGELVAWRLDLNVDHGGACSTPMYHFQDYQILLIGSRDLMAL